MSVEICIAEVDLGVEICIAEMAHQGPTVWVLFVDQVEIHCTSEVLLNQEKFARLCLDEGTAPPKIVSKKEWRKYVQNLFFEYKEEKEKHENPGSDHKKSQTR